jgi:hypothetical protein
VGKRMRRTTIFCVEQGGIDVERDKPDAVGEDLVDDHARVVPHVHALNHDRRHLRPSARPYKKGGKARTSAMRMRRKAFAMDASTPTRSNSIDRFESRVTATFRP